MSQPAWVEVWIDSASEGGYLLVLRPASNGELQVSDPQDGAKAIAAFVSYEDAVHWLNEDEYDLVGRWNPSDNAGD
jgi:hypothetical protein